MYTTLEEAAKTYEKIINSAILLFERTVQKVEISKFRRSIWTSDIH